MKDLDILMPVYNEKESITRVLSEWEKFLNKNKITHNFIICEDGSTDGTKELLKKLKTKFPLVLNQKPYRRGYGPAVIDGIRCSKAKYLLCIDSDGQCDPRDLKAFWNSRMENGVIIGWRTKREDSPLRKLYSRSFYTLFRFLYSSRLHDPSAPFVLFRRKTIMPYAASLKQMKEGFWWGFVATCAKFKIPIKELPMNHRPRYDGKTQVYHASKIPSIAYRNIYGLLTIRYKNIPITRIK